MKVELVGGSWDAVDPLLPLGDPACSQWLSLHEGTSTPRSLLTEAIVKAWPEPAGAVHRLSSDGKELRLSPPLWSCVQPLRVFLLFLPGECTGGLSLHSHKVDIALVSNNLLEQPLPSLHPIHPQHTQSVAESPSLSTLWSQTQMGALNDQLCATPAVRGHMTPHDLYLEMFRNKKLLPLIHPLQVLFISQLAPC